MSEIEALFLTDTGFFMSCLFAAIWLTALVGTVYEVIRKRNRKPCKHTTQSELSSTSQILCYDCNELISK